MNKVKIQNYLILLLFALLYIFAWRIQDQFLLKGDVSWQMHLARLVLSGGNYVKDFFEINPPLSIYLYMPAVFLQQKFSISGILALRIYIFIFATLSLILCHSLFKKISPSKDKNIRLLFIVTLFFVYLILPFEEFGQRECLLLYLTMPYFLLISIRLKPMKINLLPAVNIGILAGLGFAIKPFFIFAFCLVEIYFLSKQITLRKRLISWIRPETVCIFLIFIFYLIFIYFFHPNYIKVVVPLAANFYYQSFSLPLTYVFFNPLVIYISLTPVFYFFLSANELYKQLFIVLLMALAGFLAAYLVQQLPWYYHVLPAFSIAVIVYVLSFVLFLRQYRCNTSEFLFVLLVCIFIFSYPLFFIKKYYEKCVMIKNGTQPLINELREKREKKYIFFFSSNAAYMVSVFEHADVLHASRLQFLAWMQHYHHASPSQTLAPHQKNEEAFFVTMLADDIKKNKPILIYVDQSQFITYEGKSIKIDYIKILSHYPNFKKVWKMYHYWKTVENPSMYKFDIYKLFNKYSKVD